MLRLSKRRRELLIEKLPDAANVTLGSLVFGQFLGVGPPSVPLLVAGIAIWVLLTTGAWLISGGRDGR
jgi:hypothetical protein